MSVEASPGRITAYARDGMTFDVLDAGPLDGDVVVLLHGFPQLNTSWAQVAPLLHERGFRTLAPNQRGYSPGARPRGRRGYRMSELTKDVAALIHETGGPVHLVGHDWGAAAAWAVAIARPQLVRTLTTVSVPHPGAFAATMRKGQALRSWYMGFFNLPRLPELTLTNRTLARRSLRGSGMSAEMFDRYWRDFGDPATVLGGVPGPLPGGLGWYRALAFGNRSLLSAKVRVPTTHVWSDGDHYLVRAGAELTEEYVDAAYRLEVIDGASHWLPEERPDELARIIADRAATAP